MAEASSVGGGVFMDFTESMLGGARGIVALYIDAGERFAKQMLEFHAAATGWAADTQLGSLFQAQNSFGQGIVEFWAGATRAIWRIEEHK